MLLLSLSLSSVDALKCYVCNSTTSNADCNKEICLTQNATCMITENNEGEKKVMQQCVSSEHCTQEKAGAGLSESGKGIRVTCCITDRCINAAVATAKPSSGATIHIHTALLLLPLGVLSLLSKYYR
ncbi:hypothetical protein J4Q44_G00391530 [Coregonus suidteri]|uniref:Snake toxin/toxin-like domain-containing protein n=1 Tax=Coregonus suidteri TaxID=861788 RepID=A0AAN8Q3M1_9TELE